MKSLNNILIAFLLSCSAMLNGQSYLYQAKLFTSNLDAFTGVWEYKTENEVLRVYLIKGTVNTKLSLGDCIIGDYYYQKNGIVMDSYIENLIPNVVNDQNEDYIPVYASNGRISENLVDSNELYMYFYDKRLKKIAPSCQIKLISPTQIRWILADGEGIYSEEDIMGFSIPMDVILTKIR